MKGNVFTTPPASIEDMRDRIVNELANLREDPEMIKRVFRDMQRRAELCIERGGRHVEGHKLTFYINLFTISYVAVKNNNFLIV